MTEALVIGLLYLAKLAWQTTNAVLEMCDRPNLLSDRMFLRQN